MSRSVTVRAPGKLNLELRVGAPRLDGFHALATVFQALALADDVTVTAVDHRLNDGVEVSVGGELSAEQLAAVPLDESNLVVRAARLLADLIGPRRAQVAGLTGVSIHLHKRIPVAGGMAGGSADAAGVLVALETLWQHPIAVEDRLALAAELGSDVTFPLTGGTAVGMGRGEQISPVMVRGTYHWVLALSGAGLSTPEVFAETDRLRHDHQLPPPRVSDALISALRAGDAVAVGANLVNELEPATLSLRPDLEHTLLVGRKATALGALISGSGPTAAFLVRDADHAQHVARDLSDAEAADHVVVTTGPAPGVRVVEVS